MARRAALELALRLVALVRQHLLHEGHLLGDDLLGVPDLPLQPVGGHLHVTLDLRPHLRAAEVEVRRAAGRAQVFVGKLLEVVIAPATLVVFQVAGVAVLDRGVALDPVLLTQVLAIGGAIDIGHESSRRALEVFHQLVPIGLQRLAVASPWREELDKNALPRRLGVPRGGRELDRTRAEGEEGQDGQNPGSHHGRSRREVATAGGAPGKIA
mmetsp:Transcript_99253/g.315071  ORF Transcript_99253/g.315071 Transcript_99253/m.315071 type:complete len:212 (+) Transcript_99253:185-820(+)